MAERMKLDDVAIPREELDAIRATLSDEQRAELDAAKARVERYLNDPVQQARRKEQYEAAQKYWDEHPEIHDITVYCGKLK